MTGNSALARVLSFRRSLPSIDRLAVDAGASDASVEAGLPADPASPYESTGLGEAGSPAPEASPAPLIVELPSLKQVTLVADQHQAVAKLDPVREAVTVDAISAIEDDIASLLSTMSELSDARPVAVSAAAAGDEGEDGDDATLTLLSELDRLWRADPMIGAANQS